MKGFSERADVEEVLRFLALRSAALAAEPVAVDACAGRVLAAQLRSEVDVPGFARTA